MFVINKLYHYIKSVINNDGLTTNPQATGYKKPNYYD